jgi:EmrB/QacA subfamily drug resistance transporter
MAGSTPGPSATAENKSGNYKWKVAAVVSGSFLFSAMDLNSALVALPTIAGDYAVDLPTVQWVVLISFLSMNALLLPLGRLSDLAGRKRLFVIGLLVTGIGGIFSFLAPGLGWLYAARAVQGAGAAALQAVGPPLLIAAFPANERGKAMGVNVTMVSTGLMLGPVLGGLIAGSIGWRFIFLLPVPVMILGAYFGARVLRETPKTEGEGFDFPGTALLIGWMLPLFYMLNRGSKLGWGSPTILVLAGVVAVAFAGFVMSQLRSKHPVVALSVFRNRSFTTAVVVATMNFLAFGATVLLVPFMLQNQLGLGVAKVGLVMAVIPLSSLALASSGGILSDRFGARVMTTIGLLLRAGGLLALGFMAAGATIGGLIAPMIAVGVGQALFQPPNASALLSALPRRHGGVAGGFLALSRTFGMGMGQVVWGAVFAAVVTGAAGVSSALDAPPEIMADGFRVSFVGAGVILLLAAALAVSRGKGGAAAE